MLRGDGVPDDTSGSARQGIAGCLPVDAPAKPIKEYAGGKKPLTVERFEARLGWYRP